MKIKYLGTVLFLCVCMTPQILHAQEQSFIKSFYCKTISIIGFECKTNQSTQQTSPSKNSNNIEQNNTFNTTSLNQNAQTFDSNTQIVERIVKPVQTTVQTGISKTYLEERIAQLKQELDFISQKNTTISKTSSGDRISTKQIDRIYDDMGESDSELSSSLTASFDVRYQEILGIIQTSTSTPPNLSSLTTDNLNQGVTNLYSQWGTSGSNIFYTTGNVGIGTNSPTQKLTISSNTVNTDVFTSFSSLSVERLRLGYNYNTGVIDNLNTAQIFVDGNGDLHLSSRTNINSDMMFYTTSGTDALERMRIEHTGEIGIGTIAPESVLHINSSSTTSYLSISNNSSSAGTLAGIRFKATSGLNYYKGGIIWEDDGQSSARGKLHLAVNDNDDGTNVGISDSRFTILSSGEIGISTTNPARSLTINDSIAPQLPILGFSQADTEKMIIGVANTSNALFTGSLFGDTVLRSTGKMMIGSGSSPALTINTSNSIGIGTTAPDSILNVFGSNPFISVNENTGNTGSVSGIRFKNTSSAGDTYYKGALIWEDDGQTGARGKLHLAVNNATDTSNASTTDARLTIISSGSVGVGVTSPLDKLQVVGDVRVGTTGTNGCVKNFAGTGLTGTCSSDERLKTNITELSGPILEELLTLKPISYQWNDTAKSIQFVDTSVVNYGLLAQNVEVVFPELVSVDKDGYKQVDYSRIYLYILRGVQELATKVSSVFDGTANIFVNILRVKKEICIEEVCIDKETLIKLLDQQNINLNSQQQTIETQETDVSTQETQDVTSENTDNPETTTLSPVEESEPEVLEETESNISPTEEKDTSGDSVVSE